MNAFRAVLLVLLVVSTTVAVLPTAAVAADDVTGDATTPGALLAATTQNDTANDSSLGADISSFMQSSAAEVGGAVETGMWSAAYDATENRTVRSQLVERKTSDLRAELAELRERKQDLLAEREAGNISNAAYKARVGQLVGQINALENAINATETRARDANANVENLTNLRTEASELSGPEVAAVARNLSGVGVANAGERGPPSDVGNANESGARDGNRTDAGNGNGNENRGGASNQNGAGASNQNSAGANNENSDEASTETNAGNGTPSDGDAGGENAAGEGTETDAGNGNGNENGTSNGGGNGNSAAGGESETTTGRPS